MKKTTTFFPIFLKKLKKRHIKNDTEREKEQIMMSDYFVQ